MNSEYFRCEVCNYYSLRYKMDCRKRKSNITDFIQHLSPQKTSAKGNPYYTLQVQTSAQMQKKFFVTVRGRLLK